MKKILISLFLISLSAVIHAAPDVQTTGTYTISVNGVIIATFSSTGLTANASGVRTDNSTVTANGQWTFSQSVQTSSLTVTNAGDARITQTATANSGSAAIDQTVKTSAGVSQRWLTGLGISDAAGTWAVRDQTSSADRIAVSTGTGRVSMEGGNGKVEPAINTIGSIVSTYTAAIINAPGSSNVFGNIVSFTLTPGSYFLSGTVESNLNTATANTYMNYAMSAFSGNTTTDAIETVNSGENAGPTAGVNKAFSLPCWPITITTPTTYYLKVSFDYSTGTPRVYGAMFAIKR